MNIHKGLQWIAITLVGVIALYATGVFSGLNGGIASAAISVFQPSTCYAFSTSTATAYGSFAATTSLSYISKGLATTTVRCNLAPDGASSAVAKVIVNASTTASIFNFKVEESLDGIDWFAITPILTASTSPNITLDTFGTLSYTFASSTIGGVPVSTGLTGASGVNNRNQFVFDIPVRMQHVRVISSMASSTALPELNQGNGAVNIQIVPRIPIN